MTVRKNGSSQQFPSIIVIFYFKDYGHEICPRRHFNRWLITGDHATITKIKCHRLFAIHYLIRQATNQSKFEETTHHQRALVVWLERQPTNQNLKKTNKKKNLPKPAKKITVKSALSSVNETHLIETNRVIGRVHLLMRNYFN